MARATDHSRASIRDEAASGRDPSGTSSLDVILGRHSGTSFRYVIPVRHSGTSFRYIVGEQGSHVPRELAKRGLGRLDVSADDRHGEAHEGAVGPSVSGTVQEHVEDLLVAPGDHPPARVVPEVDQRPMVALRDDEALRLAAGADLDRNDVGVEHVPATARQTMLGRMDRRRLPGGAVPRLALVVADVEMDPAVPGGAD